MIDTKEIRERYSERLRASYYMHAGFPAQGDEKQRERELREIIDLLDELDAEREKVRVAVDKLNLLVAWSDSTHSEEPLPIWARDEVETILAGLQGDKHGNNNPS